MNDCWRIGCLRASEEARTRTTQIIVYKEQQEGCATKDAMLKTKATPDNTVRSDQTWDKQPNLQQYFIRKHSKRLGFDKVEIPFISVSNYLALHVFSLQYLDLTYY